MAKVDVQALKILVVEDNVHFRTLVRTILQALGVGEIEEARDGGEAFEVLKNFPADLAIMDWKMDGVDGVECVRRIRADSDSPNRFLPLIMVTGYTEASLIEEARNAGVNDFLGKPISAKSLLSRIVAVLETPPRFVEAPGYFGPDRRRRQVPHKGEERRHAEPAWVDVPRRGGGDG